MINLTEYKFNSIVSEKLDYIDNTLLCESLQAKVLKDVAKQLLDQINKEKEGKDSSYRYWISNKGFHEIFSKIPCEWDKITDDDIDKIEVPEDPVKNDKIVRAVIRKNTTSLILAYDENEKKFKYAIASPGDRGVVYLYPAGYMKAGDTTGSRRHDLSEKEKVEMFRGLTLYVIKDFKKYVDNKLKINTDRRNSREGMIYMDPTSMREYARKNIERYKEIIADKKFKELDNDDLLDDVNLVLQKISEIVTIVAKDPVTYADSIRDVTNLNLMAYDTPKYDSKSGRSYGQTGLLSLLSSYIEKYEWYGPGSKRSFYSNSDSGYKQITVVKDQLERQLNKAKQLIGKVEVQMGL